MEVKYVARLEHVREVTLFGAADLDYWKPRLHRERLEPVVHGGRAQILIISAAARFRGLSFSECSFSVLATDGERDGAFLVQAFNSRRFFAFSERFFFHTPYVFSPVRVSTDPVTVEVDAGFRVEGPADLNPEQLRRAPGGWNGQVFLSTPRGPRRWFIAEVHGETLSFPFDAVSDRVTLSSRRSDDVFAALVASHFRGVEWSIREDATHAKSKTYRRLL